MTTINKTIQISERTFKKCVGRLPQSIDELNFFAEHFVEYEWEDLISGDWAEYFDEVGDEYHLPPEPEEMGSHRDAITVPLYHYINEEPPLCPEDPAIGDKMYDTDSIAEEIERLFHQHTGIKISVAMRVK